MKSFFTVMRWLGFGVMLGYLACALTPLPNVAARMLSAETDAATAGAIVVLGADVRLDGNLGDASLRRTITGLQQLQKGTAPLILFLGNTPSGEISEALVRRQLAVDLGIPAEAIAVDAYGRTTREEARRVKALIGPKRIDTIVLVSDGIHLRRARRVFEQEGFTVSVVTANTIPLNVASPEQRLHLMRSVAQQALALLVYWMTE